MAEPVKKKVIVGVQEKIAHHGRDVAHKHLEDGDFIEMFSEETPEGHPTRYGAKLTDEAIEEFRNASNCEYVEEGQEMRILGESGTMWGTEEGEKYRVLGEPKDKDDDSEAATHELDAYGIEKAALDFSRFFDARPAGNQKVAVLVGDTGYGETPYIKDKIAAIWDLVDPGGDGLDRHGHGKWCGNAAVAVFAREVSAKVLGDDGRGNTVDGVAAVDRFVSWCRKFGYEGAISYSLGSPSYSQAYEDAGRRALENGIVPVAATGNDGRTDGISFPGGCESWFAAGSCSHHDNTVSSFSNRKHPVAPQCYGPGGQVFGYGGRWNGTSMWTPQLARGICRLVSMRGIGPARAKKAITQTARDKSRYGTIGRLDLEAAMLRAVEMVG